MFAEDWHNNEILENMVVSTYNCPSSPFDPLLTQDHGSYFADSAQRHGYAGIAGVYPDPSGRLTGTCVSPRDYPGWVCNNGLLPVNENKSFRDVADGASNTVLAAEQSGQIGIMVDDKLEQLPASANYPGGWAGALFNADATSVTTPGPCGIVSCYATGVTTVMFAPNTKTATIGYNDFCYRNNTVLNSFHPGIIQVVLADGSVRSLKDDMDLDILKRFCCADDGVPLGEF